MPVLLQICSPYASMLNKSFIVRTKIYDFKLSCTQKVWILSDFRLALKQQGWRLAMRVRPKSGNMRAFWAMCVRLSSAITDKADNFGSGAAEKGTTIQTNLFERERGTSLRFLHFLLLFFWEEGIMGLLHYKRGDKYAL